MKNINIKSIIGDCLKRGREIIIDKWGIVEESNQFNNYWHSLEYVGPFSREYDGKFCYSTNLNRILNDATLLTPFVRKNEIIGFKHRTKEDISDEPLQMLIYASHKDKARVLEILKKIGAMEVQWKEDNTYLNSLYIANVERQMIEQKVNSPYAIKTFNS
ncbi:MAG: hypothetical protein Q7R52_03935 [archaeon]|nr:hypothetical protein [archaeon]